MRILFLIIRSALVSTFVMLVMLGVFGAAYLESNLPSVETLKDMRLKVPLRVYSNDGKLMAEFGEERRTPIALSQVPKDLINAILATEDQRFYAHSGVDIRGLIRAGVHLLTNVSVKQGGSTITMQVARNYFLTRKKTFVRKLSEILLALKIEKEFTKDEILELYLNKIYFGKRAYGVAAAAEVYYGTTVDQLTLDQIAMIAGLPQAPSSINPLHDKEAAFKRRKHVLDRMLSYNYITKEQFDKANAASLPTRYHGRTIELDAPYVAEMVRQDLYSRFGEDIYSLGYEVFTTLDSQQQLAANHALRRGLLEYDQRHGYRKSKIRFKLPKNKKAEQMLEEWRDLLEEIPAYGNLIPGVVMRVADQSIQVELQDERRIDIPWSGLSWARPQLKGGKVGAFPRRAQDIVALGEVIYVQGNSNESSQENSSAKTNWRLSQIPEAAAALVAMDSNTGAINALIGGFDYSLSSYNRAVQAERQPGSNFKPFLYAAALDQGYTLASVFNDAPFTYVDPVTKVTWQPQNATKRFYGPTRLRVSLKRSQNMVTVRVLQAIGLPTAIDFIEKFGFERSKLPAFMSLALGVGVVSPLQLASAYCVFSNGGSRITPHFIKSIKDYQGAVIYEANPPPPTPVINPQIAYLITSALQDAIQSGTGQRAKSLGREDLAGKTGTTNEWVDAWYSGYNRDLVATVWMGFDDNRSLKEFGSTAALPLWIYFMDEVLKDKPEHVQSMPPGLIVTKIDPNNGYLAREGQANAVYEIFTEETVPEYSSGPSYFDDGYGQRSYGNEYEEYTGRDSLF